MDATIGIHQSGQRVKICGSAFCPACDIAGYHPTTGLAPDSFSASGLRWLKARLPAFSMAGASLRRPKRIPNLAGGSQIEWPPVSAYIFGLFPADPAVNIIQEIAECGGIHGTHTFPHPGRTGRKRRFNCFIKRQKLIGREFFLEGQARGESARGRFSTSTSSAPEMRSKRLLPSSGSSSQGRQAKIKDFGGFAPTGKSHQALSEVSSDFRRVGKLQFHRHR